MPTSLGIALAVFLALHQFARLHPFLGLLSTWPSTVLHELAHFFVALLLGAQPTGISVVPRRVARDQWLLGSVTFAPSFWTTSWVALAPLAWAGVALIICFAATPVGLAEAVARGVACGVLFQASVPSATDWKLALKYPGGLALMLLFAGLGLSAAR